MESRKTNVCFSHSALCEVICSRYITEWIHRKKKCLCPELRLPMSSIFLSSPSSPRVTNSFAVLARFSNLNITVTPSFSRFPTLHPFPNPSSSFFPYLLLAVLPFQINGSDSRKNHPPWITSPHDLCCEDARDVVRMILQAAFWDPYFLPNLLGTAFVLRLIGIGTLWLISYPSPTYNSLYIFL